MTSRTPLSGSKKLARTANRLFHKAKYHTRMMQVGRPYICPFEIIIRAIPENASVLDIGCGCGLFLGLLATEKDLGNGVGIDVNRSSIATARRMVSDLKLANKKSRLQFYHSELNAMDIPDRFDVVSLVDVMHHIPVADRHALFINAVDRIQPSGMLLYKDISITPRWRAWANQLHDLVVAREWVHHIAIEEVEQWAIESGLVLECSEYIPMLWYGHDLRIWSKTNSLLGSNG